MVVAVTVSAQTTFFNLYGSAVGEEGNRVINVPGGGYVVAGGTDAAGFGSRDLAVWRMDASGNVMWCTKLGTIEWEWVRDITPISSGGFYVAIESVDPSTWQNTATVVTKLDANGSILWTQQYSTLTYAETREIEATANGGFVFMTMEDSGSYNGCIRLISCNSSGGILWSKMFLTSAWYYASALVQCGNGDFVISITKVDASLNHYLLLMRVSSSGSLIWCTESPASSTEATQGMVCSGNEFYISTATNGLTHQLYKYSSTGSCIWARTISIPSFIHYGWVYGITVNNGKVCMVGNARNLGNYYEGHIEEFDTAGNLLNSGFLFTGVKTDLNDVTYNAAGDIVLTGSVRAGFAASDTLSMYLAVGDLAAGTICGYIPFPFTVTVDTPLVASNISLTSITTGTTSSFAMLTSTGSLIQIGCIVGVEEFSSAAAHLYPNPTNDILTIENSSGQATFHLYNNLGQCVQTVNLVGTKTEISVGELAEGIYYYDVVDENGKVYSDKLVIQ